MIFNYYKKNSLLIVTIVMQSNLNLLLILQRFNNILFRIIQIDFINVWMILQNFIDKFYYQNKIFLSKFSEILNHFLKYSTTIKDIFDILKNFN